MRPPISLALANNPVGAAPFGPWRPNRKSLIVPPPKVWDEARLPVLTRSHVWKLGPECDLDVVGRAAADVRYDKVERASCFRSILQPRLHHWPVGFANAESIEAHGVQG